MGLAEIALGAGRASATGGRSVVDIVTFIEAPWGLNMKLFPIQKVILKTYYGLALEDKIPSLTFTDWRRTNERNMTEADYLKMLFDDGRCNIREVVPGRERRELVLSIGRRAGKCVVGNTLVLTSAGVRRIDTMGDTNGPEYQPLAIGVVQEAGRRSQTAFFYNGGVQPTLCVTTAAGATLEGTGKHRIKVQSPDGAVHWCRLDDVQVGTRVCIALGSNLWGQGRLDGGISFFLGVDSSTTPDSILSATAPVVRNFLRGVVHQRGYGDRLIFDSIEYARQIRVLLLNFGVLCSLQTAGMGAWLSIDSSYVDLFDLLMSYDEFQVPAPSYAYDEVVSVVPDEAPVYDLNVPDGASFVANGMTNHNTTMSACIAAYETYRLINKGDPQGYYGLPASNNIQLISVATDKDQAGLLYQEVSGHFKGCAFFMPYTANNTQSYARFQSPKDIERYGSYGMDNTAKATIKVTFRSCVAKGLRGAGNIVIILDEVAHFTDDGQSSADAVYSAVVPSSAAFSRKDPLDQTKPIGEVESKVISISSPLGRQGMFYKLFDTGFQSAKISEERLCIQAPTWEVNPTVPAGFFEAEYVKDARTFFTEYGAQFSDRTRGWLESESDLTACIEPSARPRQRAAPRAPHFAGIDVALVGDYSTIAIGHTDEQNRIVVDLVEGIRAGEGQYEDCERLEFMAVAEWIHDFSKRFYITEGLFDQWLGIPLEQALVAKGLRQFKSFKSTPQLNSQMFQNFKDMMFDRRLVLYDWPIPTGEAHCQYITELLELQAEFKSKYVTVVEAPKVAGKHDDHADALIRMVWSASQSMGKHSTIAGHRNLPGQRSAGPMSGYALRRKSMQTGSHPDRMIPGSMGPSRFVGGVPTGDPSTGRALGGTGRGPSRLEKSITPPWRKKGR